MDNTAEKETSASIEKGQIYAVAGTDSSFQVEEVLENGGYKVKWLDSGSVVELSGVQVKAYLTSGQLKLVKDDEPAAAETPATEPAAAETPATEPAAASQPAAEATTEEPTTSGRLRVKRVVRHIPNAAYIAVMKRAATMSPAELAAALAKTAQPQA